MKRIKLKRKKRIRLVQQLDTLFMVKRRKTGDTIKRFIGVDGLQAARQFISGKRTLYITTLPSDRNAVEQFVSVPEPVGMAEQFHLVEPQLLGSRR